MSRPIPRTIRIEPPRGAGLNLAELWAYRELLFFFVWRDTKVRYKQTVLGVAWAIIQPLAATFLFTIFLGHFAGMSDRVSGPYSLHLFVSLIPWTFFSNVVSLAAFSLVGSSHLISKIYFPRLIVPVAPIVAGVIDFGVAFSALLLLMPLYGASLGWHLLAVPLFFAGTLAAAAGAGILFAAIVVSYRDFRFVMTFMMQLWLFATPVLYSFDVIPERWRLLIALNPMTGMVAGFRASVLGGPFPMAIIAVSAASALAMLLVGVQYFARVERRFADVI